MAKKIDKKKSPRNRTISLTRKEQELYLSRIISLTEPASVEQIINKTINQDLFEAIDFLPDNFIDLLFVDPPYNMRKEFNQKIFQEKTITEYSNWIDSFLSKLIRCLKPDSSIYFCGDWKSSTSIHSVLNKYFKVRNRITWEREKGRGSQKNWKNNSEDIWYATRNENHKFNYDKVRLKRKVIAPYRRENGEPKDWEETPNGLFRSTLPSNIWTDISVPFWSMTENTSHPTQKPEKLLAKIILASSAENDIVFDPFLGSGTTSVVAKKLGRRYVGIEVDKSFACLTEKRLEAVEDDKSIQGYFDGVFWERNTFMNVKMGKKKRK